MQDGPKSQKFSGIYQARANGGGRMGGEMKQINRHTGTETDSGMQTALRHMTGAKKLEVHNQRQHTFNLNYQHCSLQYFTFQLGFELDT